MSIYCVSLFFMQCTLILVSIQLGAPGSIPTRLSIHAPKHAHTLASHHIKPYCSHFGNPVGGYIRCTFFF